MFLRLANSWYAGFGPALVIWAAGEPSPSLSALLVLAVALPAQFALEFASVAGCDRIARGTPIRPQLPFVARAWVVDLALTPVGLLAAIAAAEVDGAIVLLLPLLGLLLRVRARAEGAASTPRSSSRPAYRGTAFLLGDVIEADDAYTGSPQSRRRPRSRSRWRSTSASTRGRNAACRAGRAPPRRGQDPRPERDHQRLRRAWYGCCA